MSSDSKGRRVVRPETRYRPLREEIDEERAHLLSKIQSFYAQARDRLAGVGVGAGGICVGLLDPVSNIVIANNLPDDDEPVEEEELARRSLEGLVAFLLYFFPYLAAWDAVRYLLLADADLLVAARLVVSSRGMAPAFSIASAASTNAFRPALRLAAHVAGHPHPERLVRRWMSSDNLVLEQSWRLAASREQVSDAPCINNTWSLMLVHLDAIRVFYLRALARLPPCELRTRYHEVMVKAGHCYGPMDPVSNIIINTVWYHAAFPSAALPPVLDMIGPRILTRVESRSMYGLISFLQTRHHHLSQHQIVQSIVAASGDLSKIAADSCDCDAGVQEAYEAAAMAAWHPEPEAQAAFLATCKAKLQESPAAMSLLLHNTDRVLSPEDVRFLAGVLLADQMPSPQPVVKKSFWPVLRGKMRSMAEQNKTSAKVRAALNQQCFLQDDGEPMYELHVICGANYSVGVTELCADEDDFLSLTPCKFKYMHVNFLATEKGASSQSPLLFFAEFLNISAEGEQPVLCCKVDMPLPYAEHVRCMYCENRGAKVVHPAFEKFHGGDKEFEEVRLGGHDEDFMGNMMSMGRVGCGRSKNMPTNINERHEVKYR
uniref:Uncharacterized protein n=1 Tax=Leersia perrieri TaxID=77586 RepID=A0A0D9XHD2_9ORYZ